MSEPVNLKNLPDYHPEKIESAAQAKWQSSKVYEVANDAPNPKYVLSMFPYPSGKLHVGHVRNYTISDVISRFYRLQGFDVLQPMGWDAFGLPAENAAIKHKVAPHAWTMDNIAVMRDQLKALGLAVDWSRELATCTPEYYRHEQWLFTQLYKKELVYKKLSTVNWDPVDQTVLANEQVVDGRGWRSGALVEKREIPMYYFRITDYADELLNDLDTLEGKWPAQVITQQRNWIGKSTGLDIRFQVQNVPAELQTLSVYTTRPDTLMGVTYLCVAAEHPLALEASHGSPELAAFCMECRQGSVAEADVAKAPKRGMDTGLEAVHPITGELVPVWVGNYVLMSYGSGAVMAVPAHDERDFEFASHYGLDIKQVIDTGEGELETLDAAITERGVLINSGEFNGLNFDAVLDAINHKLGDAGDKKVQFRLRDWGVSRQRYWGCPIPMINCEACGSVPVPESDLPVVLPTDVVPDGTGNPLAKMPEFYEVKCPSCGADARRETDTFDTFVESSWYYARYLNPADATSMTDVKAAKNWLPVDQYIGGIEHAVMHLLYARFFHKLMRDEGLVESDEPFDRLLTQGMVLGQTYYRSSEGQQTQWFAPSDVELKLDDKGAVIGATSKADGAPISIGGIEKMSKSKNNGEDPQTIIDTYGADAVRLFTLFAAPAEQSLEWNSGGLKGASSFLKKVWRLVKVFSTESTAELPKIDQSALSSEAADVRRKTHETIQKIEGDMQRLALNTPVSSLMELLNSLSRFEPKTPMDRAVYAESVEVLLTLLAPFAPHICDNLLEGLGIDPLKLKLPKVDESALVQAKITMVVQVNGKVRGRIEIAPDTPDAEVLAAATAAPGVDKFIEGGLKKQIVVKNKLVSLVV